MGVISIYKEDGNIEVMARIANSVARKYDCTFKYNTATRDINFTGDRSCRASILEEALAIFNQGRQS